MRSIQNRRGISPIVATIMLVGISIAAFAFIFTYTRGMVGEQTEKFGEPIENWCGKIVYDASISGNTIYINNLASVPIYGFNIEMSDANGKISVKFARSADGIIDPAESDSITEEISGATKIKITPVILGKGKNTGKGKIFACDDVAKEFV